MSNDNSSGSNTSVDEESAGQESAGQGYIDEDLSEEYASREGGDPRTPEDVAGVKSSGIGERIDGRTIAALVALGVVMVFIPEPITTILGLGFVVGGILLLLFSWLQ